MQITNIKQQIKRTGRYSIFVDGKYAFSLSAEALLERKLVVGQPLTRQGIRELQRLSADNALYTKTLRFVSLRLRSKWEVENYLQRKKASPALIEGILNKLSILALIDDEKFAKAYVNDRRLLRPTSRRKITNELRKKHISQEIIEIVVAKEPEDELSALQAIVQRKRQQPRYQDDLRLMQYLSRQGFSYGDIKTVLQQESPD